MSTQWLVALRYPFEPDRQPGVMLPDPNKAYGDDGLISSLWVQFADVLRRAKRVFVLGHSLNDQALLDAIRTHVPSDRTKVAVLADESDPARPASGASEVIEKANGSLICTYTPMRFGSSLDAARADVADWLQRTSSSR